MWPYLRPGLNLLYTARKFEREAHSCVAWIACEADFLPYEFIKLRFDVKLNQKFGASGYFVFIPAVQSVPVSSNHRFPFTFTSNESIVQLLKGS